MFYLLRVPIPRTDVSNSVSIDSLKSMYIPQKDFMTQHFRCLMERDAVVYHLGVRIEPELVQ